MGRERNKHPRITAALVSRFGSGDLVVGLGNHLIDRGHSPGVKITVDKEFWGSEDSSCGVYAARSVNIWVRYKESGCR